MARAVFQQALKSVCKTNYHNLMCEYVKSNAVHVYVIFGGFAYNWFWLVCLVRRSKWPRVMQKISIIIIFVFSFGRTNRWLYLYVIFSHLRPQMRIISTWHCHCHYCSVNNIIHFWALLPFFCFHMSIVKSEAKCGARCPPNISIADNNKKNFIMWISFVIRC